MGVDALQLLVAADKYGIGCAVKVAAAAVLADGFDALAFCWKATSEARARIDETA